MYEFSLVQIIHMYLSLQKRTRLAMSVASSGAMAIKMTLLSSRNDTQWVKPIFYREIRVREIKFFAHRRAVGRSEILERARNNSDSMSKKLGGHNSTILVLNCQNLGGHMPPWPPSSYVPVILHRDPH